ncbi:tannase-domain-containing protein [Macroventuria anomochaeta]|uniref:Tannase-domain-containing protein n=1 Tax=Macroventuria anomochaeta TaxID=301207 RepID=A0ACB6RZQ4_9PLEO|nr:tannase-domain-containing protein [Macroventuria anomochaeta]KAF2626890.1 tannase-domain-containing protein [Macroventuria anomochaeta]
MVTESFYEKAPTYSYWNGCSQGSRRGMMLAQRYPKAFDGILAGAPVLNMIPLFASLFHAQAVMNTLGEYPHNCEFEAIAAAAIATCDSLDGVEDWIISILELCSFDPFKLVGQPVNCSNSSFNSIPEAEAIVANATWYGIPNWQGERVHAGYTLDTPFDLNLNRRLELPENRNLLYYRSLGVRRTVFSAFRRAEGILRHFHNYRRTLAQLLVRRSPAMGILHRHQRHRPQGLQGRRRKVAQLARHRGRPDSFWWFDAVL